MPESRHIHLEIPDAQFGQRIDKALGSLRSDLSRSAIQSLIKQGMITVDDEVPKQKDKVYGGEKVDIELPSDDQEEWLAEPLSIDVVHEDDSVIVVNKPAGLVVHPGAGNLTGTLLNGIIYRWSSNAALPRAGIVHRLDKDTSGLMVVAKTEQARLYLIERLANHDVERQYKALCYGNIISGGTVDEAIARDAHDRRKMAINAYGKHAITHYRVAERFRHHTMVDVELETGRTHQIRVHLSFKGFSLVGDPVYGRRLAIASDCHPKLEQQLRQFKRQALHAEQLSFEHPVSSQPMTFYAPTPDDMSSLIAACRIDSQDG